MGPKPEKQTSGAQTGKVEKLKASKTQLIKYGEIVKSLAGTWADQHGRKGLMYLSITGQLLVIVTFGINYYFIRDISWKYLYLELIWDFCGSFVTYYMMEYSYIIDVTTVSERYRAEGN